MKQLLAVCISLVLGLGIFGSAVSAETQEDTNPANQQSVELTDKQKKELDKLYTDLFKTHKKIIKKYEKYGVISKEKAEKKLEFLEKHHAKMKENGFVPKWRHHHKNSDDDRKQLHKPEAEE